MATLVFATIISGELRTWLLAMPLTTKMAATNGTIWWHNAFNSGKVYGDSNT